MNVLDLFSGIGGFSLGLEAVGFQTTQFCEIDPYCQKVLKKHWPEVPCHDDIKTYSPILGSAELVCGGYPCQPFSAAGKRQGEADERHLWPEMLRIIRSVRPRWVVAENVAGHIELGFDEVAASLAAEGFTIWTFIIPACAVDAQHRRDRVWIVANAKCSRRQQMRINPAGQSLPETVGKESSFGIGSGGADVADPESITVRPGLCTNEPTRFGWRRPGDSSGAREGWPVEPELGRVAHGVSNRMDRLRGLGNAVVPQIAQIIGQAIMKYERGV